mgnify:CR=1 FL=1
MVANKLVRDIAEGSDDDESESPLNAAAATACVS